MSDAPGCGAWAYARQAGIPTFCFPYSSKPYLDMPADTPSPLDTTTLVQVLKHQLGVDYIILAGYLKVCATTPSTLYYKHYQPCLRKYSVGASTQLTCVRNQPHIIITTVSSCHAKISSVFIIKADTWLSRRGKHRHQFGYYI